MEKETQEFIPVITGDGKIADETGKIFDLTQTVPGGVVAAVTLSLVLALVVIIVFTVRSMKRNGGRFVPFLLGAVTYAYFGYIMYSIIVILLNMIPGMAQFSVDNVVMRLVMTMTISGLLCVFGKYFIMKFMLKKYENVGDVLSYSAGFSAATAFPVMINWFMTMTIMNAINQEGGLINLFKDAEPKLLLEYAKNYDALINMSQQAIMYQGLFVILFIAFNLYSAVIMYGVATGQKPFFWNFIVFVIYAGLNILNALGSYEYLGHTLVFVMEALIVMASLRYIFMIAKSEMGDILRPVKKDAVAGKGKMMKNNQKGHSQFPKFK